MKKKNILLISHNFSPEPIGIGKYNGEMMDWLANQGYDCTVITTFPYYPFWKVQAPYRNKWYKKEIIKYPDSNSNIQVYRCPSYIPSNPTGKQRAIQDFSYWIAKFFVVFKLILSRKRYDLIINVAPPFHLAYLGLMLRVFNGGKLLYHIQDMQIEAARDLKMFYHKKLLAGLFRIERKILMSADYVSSISLGMIDKIHSKINKDVIFFPNWVDTEYFKPLQDRGSLKQKWGYQPDDQIYMYSGAIGVKQGLEGITLAAEKLKDNPRIKFIICASGPYKDELVKEAQKKGLSNIAFLPLQDKEVFNEFLNMADIHLVMQKATAGDLVMPSKLATIFAVGGVSIVTTSPGTSLYKMIKDDNLGYIVEPGKSDLLVEKILELEKGYDKNIGLNARNYAMKYLNIDSVMKQFVADVLHDV
ncbi:WcaI family glycosyltransferase [Mucilaginibacter calamicampi]|uniref:WcaI family glycosyltransferase n=1 Tax=Mucilaginibacter calamicampi TaxID=1302352 RepID=A0ABW2YWN1_9SPHI